MVATVGDRARLAFDRWRTPQDLARWCVKAGLLDVEPSVDARDLDAARGLRESVYRLLEALRTSREPHPQDIDHINGWAAYPALAPQLCEGGRAVRWVADAPLDAVLSTLARDTIALAEGEELSRVRECASPTCSVLFLDASRPGRRMWCSMNRCGNRAKKATFRQKKCSAAQVRQGEAE